MHDLRSRLSPLLRAGDPSRHQVYRRAWRQLSEEIRRASKSTLGDIRLTCSIENPSSEKHSSQVEDSTCS
jgi:hypothetical protein